MADRAAVKGSGSGGGRPVMAVQREGVTPTVVGVEEEESAEDSGVTTPDAALEGAPMTVYLKCALRRRSVVVTVSGCERVRVLRRLARRELGSKGVRLVLETKELDDGDASLASVGLSEGASVHVVPKMATGQERAKLTRMTSRSDEDSEKTAAMMAKDLRDFTSAYLTVSQAHLIGGTKERLAQRMSEREAAVARGRKAKTATVSEAEMVKTAEEQKRMKTKVAETIGRARSHSSTRKPVTLSLGRSLSEPELGPSVSDEKETSAKESKDEGPKADDDQCAKCRRKLGLFQQNRYTCRCNGVFCGRHRHPEKHLCSFDFKRSGKAKIAKEHPRVKESKRDYDRL